METYIAPLLDTTTQRRSQLSHGQRRMTSKRCKIWKMSIRKDRSSKERLFHADGLTTGKTLRCIIAKRARGTKSSPLSAERSTPRAAKTEDIILYGRFVQGDIVLDP